MACILQKESFKACSFLLSSPSFCLLDLYTKMCEERKGKESEHIQAELENKCQKTKR